MELIYFTVVAAGLYFASDRLLDYIENQRGARFNNRNIIFFVIILVLAFLSFGLMNYFLNPTVMTKP